MRPPGLVPPRAARHAAERSIRLPRPTADGHDGGVTRQQRTQRGFDRIVNFSDAVVAIAVTFLVLPLLDLLGESADPDTLLRESAPAFLAYALTFLIMIAFWLQHHRIFEYLDDYDGFVVWANVGWLMLIAVLPFLSALSNEGSVEGAWVLACYFFVMAGLSALITSISWWAKRHPHLLVAGADRNQLQPRIGVAVTVVLLVIGGLVLINENFGWLAAITMPLLPRLMRRRAVSPEPDAASAAH